MAVYPHQDLWKEAKLAQLKLSIESNDNVDGKRKALEMAGFGDREIAQVKVMATIRDVQRDPDMDEAEHAFDGLGIDTNCNHHEPKYKKPKLPRRK